VLSVRTRVFEFDAGVSSAVVRLNQAPLYTKSAFIM